MPIAANFGHTGESESQTDSLPTELYQGHFSRL